MGKLFGTNGIRGVFPDELSLEFISDIVYSIATYFKKGPILVGYDGRDSSPLVAKVVCSAINYCGFDCGLAGLVPTPALEYATKALGYSGGIMITASHNPPQYNGLKPAAKDGVEVSREDELIIEDIYFSKKWIRNSKKFGKTQTESRVVRTYLDGIKSQVNASKIKSKKFKVALDLGNGAQAVAAPDLCKELGCTVFLINEKIDGTFPGRGSEPTPSNLQKLSRKVIEKKADFGVAFDGDGDRSIFCDNNGKILTGDKSALLLANYLLEKNPKSKIVTCLNSSSVIEAIASKTNSEVIRTKVGSVEVSRKMVPEKALVGFEENGGFMYGKHNQVRDGAMTLALALDLIADSGKAMSEQMSALPPSYTTKDKVSCSKKEAEKIISQLKKEHKNYDATDGIKLIFDEKNWIMIRPSGTEPIARIYAEADSEEKLGNLMSKYTKKVNSILDR
ncbi:phosphoglucosamine mutase [Candidatus Nitrosotenuis sp. DW1]|uniref:phosphoglucosamine mutase n=1 Tax=Candidatus Nitrosotenuis sp. DW1 TaxID=2259672 RepID=UPI0015C70E19|nr:phosphoglucosamine mutase [Candidatus Nitrosotenuis sp. DW1]QLH09583.1 phosphoglucosamine mutase [Candidatus Nitrosotenuis sp. DW1]